jgi:hypothetical protein
MRITRNVIDLFRATSITPSDLISFSSPHVVKYKPILSIAYAISKILGHYKNLEPNNLVGVVKKELYTLADPVVYSINKNFIDIGFYKLLYNYLKKYIPDIDSIIMSKNTLST